MIWKALLYLAVIVTLVVAGLLIYHNNRGKAARWIRSGRQWWDVLKGWLSRRYH